MPNSKQKQTIIQKLKANKKGLIIISASILVAAAVTVIICINIPRGPSEPKPETTQSVKNIDYDQKVTNPDGSDFKKEYNASSDEDLSVRFTDLKCNDDCSNVSNIKINNQILRASEDYEVKKGSVIITIFKKILQGLANGSYSITFDLKENDKTITVGIKIDITNSATANDEPKPEQNSEIAENGNKEQQENKPSQNQPSGNTQQNRNQNQQNQPSTQPQPQPELEPQPEPEPEPQPVSRPDINLNDSGYFVEVDYVRYLLSNKQDFSDCYAEETDANGRTIGRIICPEFGVQTCSVTKNSAEFMTTYTVGTEEAPYAVSSEVYTSRAQLDAGIQRFISQGYRLEIGSTFGFDLNEQKCSECHLSCGRW